MSNAMSLDDIRESEWVLRFIRTVGTAPRKVDMYALRASGENDANMVTLGVPHGREDIALFIAKSVLAGQAVLRSPEGMALASIVDYGPAIGFRRN